VNDEEDSGDTDYYLAVGIHDLPDNIEPSALRTEGSWDYKKLEPFWTDLAKKEPGIKTMERAISWGNIPMAKFSVGEIQDEVTLLNAILYALHGDKLIKLECGLNIFNADPAFAERDYSKEQTCVSFFNSLQFLDYPLP
jgi:hypothetical protein